MCQRFIIPPAVLSRLAEDGDIAEDSRAALSATAACELSWRTLRNAHTRATQASLLTSRAAALGTAATGLAKIPETPVFDCRQTTSLPGVAVADPATSKRHGTTGVRRDGGGRTVLPELLWTQLR